MYERPRRNPDLNTLDMGEEGILYDAAVEEFHALNPTARLLWELCDGEHTIADMEAALRTHFAVPEDADVRADVMRTLQQFADKGLLEGE